MALKKAACIFAVTCILLSCSKQKPLFEQLQAVETGIDFNNEIQESDTFNVLSFEYIYNGGGVGTGDFNNDGLQDLFFAGNMVSSKLYLNAGDFKFKDITRASGVATTSWCTGVAVADINHDNWPDIYISTINPDRSKSSPNLLFINKGLNGDGIPIFEEAASRTGLADTGYSTQAAFFDYDLDGDLDMYMVNNALESYNRNNPVGQRNSGEGKSVDKLYRNDGNDAQGLPAFTDVSRQAGILSEGWGLGIVINDFNGDHYPDVYVSNDFLSSDHLFENNHDGTFLNRIDKYMKHEEYNGMGMDVADINNDGLNDVVVTDMMPEDNLRQKTMFSNIGYDKFILNLNRGYQPQYMRNVLQLNNGNGTFSDIGYLAGVNATDWSWSALLADFDNDGYRDLLITNGYRKDVIDLDFAVYSKEINSFGTTEIRKKGTLDAINTLEGVKKPNVIFKNNGNLTFSDKSSEWGLAQPSYSNGAVYADLDNDGDLDIVMNNINDRAFVYKNNTKNKGESNFLRVRLTGKQGNYQGVGAKLWLYYGRQLQYAEHQMQRGYKSTVESIEHFGLGNVSTIDSLVVRWPGGNSQTIENINVNQVLTLYEEEADSALTNPESNIQETIFKESHIARNVRHIQPEQDFVDFKNGQPLLPRKHSQSGPGVAVGDVNGDSLEDFIIGGVASKPAVIFLQQKNGTFTQRALDTKPGEDMGMLLFDADNDRDLDLYCVSGSSEYGKQSIHYRHRFYRNQGNGNFVPDSTALPTIQSSGSCVVACDADKDGDLDLFVGGRILPTRYPEPPASYLLINDSHGKFKDATPGELKNVGMVTAALWTDFDNDGWTDLLLAGEWMPITFFKNSNGKLIKFKPANLTADQTVGWWNSLAGGDFDNDGDTDYVAGNLGLNSLYKASEKEPVCLYAKDFDENGSVDPIMCRYIQGKEYITHPRENLTDQVVAMRRILQRYAFYGKQTFSDIFSAQKLQDALIYNATNFNSAYIENLGSGKFELHALPTEAQLSPMFGISVVDFNGDGNLDILSIGNSYSSEPLSGYYDAGIGTCLAGDGKGNFKSVSVVHSGFFMEGDAKALAELHLRDHKSLWIATSNQDSVRVFEKVHDEATTGVFIPRADDMWAEMAFSDGRKQKVELYYGSGYLSQSSRLVYIRAGVAETTIVNIRNERRKVLNK